MIEEIDIAQEKIANLTDLVGALLLLRKQFNNPHYSADSLRCLVKLGYLRAFIFEQGQVVERDVSNQTRGKSLLFLRCDLEALPKPKKGKRKAIVNRRG